MIDDGKGSWDALFVLSSLSTGGTEKKVLTIADRLNGRGRRAAVAYLGSPDPLRESAPSSLQVIDLGRRRKLSVRALQHLVELLRIHRPAAIFCAQLYCLPYVYLACRVTRYAPRRILAMVNTTTFIRLRDAVFMGLYAPILRSMDEVIFGCHAQHDDWCDRYRIARVPTSVIYNGVDAEYFAPSGAPHEQVISRSSFDISTDSVVIGTVGRLAPEKNQEILIDILPRLVAGGMNVELLIVGDGPRRAALDARASGLGVRSRVKFAGVLNDVRGALACMDIFALPSISVETFSNAALEAMATGCPVVLSKVGGASELVRDGLDGFLVEADDESAMYQATETLCRDGARRRAMALSARLRVATTFSLSGMVDEYDRRIANSLRGRMNNPGG